MRKFNAILSMAILALFLFHAITGGFQVMGIISGGSVFMNILAWVMTALIGIHTVIGIKLTTDTIKAIRRSGVSYPSENRLFWLRRISGFAIMIFILFHIIIFLGKNGDSFRLSFFGSAQLITQLLLVISIAVHVLSNIKPLLIAAGAKGFKDILVDALLILSAVLLFTGAAFIVYYIRWAS